jgi:rRNA maturation RNase YbeY
MHVTVTNQQKKFRVSTARLRRLAVWLAEQAGLQFSSLEILLTDNSGIVIANRAVFGRDYLTDVISLAYPPLPGETGGAGELIINVELAAREGARRAGGPARELALYLAHGCDHLAGANDATPLQRAAMRRRELCWLRAAARADLLRDLFPIPGR